jgi:predicted nucleic acid-binding protein
VYTFTTVVTDTNVYAVNAQDLSATNSFTVTVNAIHNGPSLGVVSNQVVNELTLLTVTNAATDNDIPALSLTYTLTVTNALTGGVVTNASISTNGIISWTPTEAQGPSTNTFTTIVSDGSLSATNSFTVTVNEVNTAPTLPVQSNRTLVGTQSLTVTNTASDSDIPVNPLGYVLTGPTGSTIDTNGVIRWTPTVGQVPGVYTFTTVVTDTNVYAVNAQDLSATNSFTVTVNAIHNGPSLGVVSNQVVNELTLLTVTNAATDNDIPALSLTYTLTVTNALTGGVVTNASISTNGIISWTPTEAQGPSTNTFTTIVSDGSLSATNSFTVTVNEVNTAPTLPVQSNRTLVGTQSLTVTNTASDSDIPINPLGYVLTGPTGSTIDTNGVIRWTPTVGQVPGVYTFTTVVTDTNVYAVNAQDLSATNSFTVTVQAIHNGPSLGVVSNQVMNELTLLTVTNAATDNDIPALPLTYTLVNPPAGAGISTNGIITWTPSQAQAPGSDVITTVVSDGSLSATNSFVVTVNVTTNDFRILSITITNGVATVTWTSVAGNYYRLQYKDSLKTTNWNSVTPDVQATNQTASATNVLGGAIQRFYRAMLVQAADVPQPVIQSINLTNSITTITWSALPPHVYRLQYTGNLGSANWNAVVPDVPATSPTAVTTDSVGIVTQRFYRIFVVQ